MPTRAPSLDIWELFDIPSIEEGGVEAYLRTILVRCADWFESYAASVFVAGIDGVIRCQASLGVSISPNATIIEGEGIAGSALHHGTAIIVEDPSDNPILVNQVTRKRREIGSAMVIPLISNGRKLGVLNLARHADDQPFNKQDLAKANTLAANISLAVANWRMIGEIKSAHDQITTVFNLLNVAILTIKGREIEQRNQEADRLFGLGSYEDILMNLPRAFSEAANEAISDAERGHSRKCQAQNGATTWMIGASPIPGGGVLLFAEDITATVQATQELSRVRRLAEIGQMTAAIAHEIRNPLTGIRSAAQLVTSVPDMSEELAKMIEDEAIKLNELCNQFLEFARPAEPVLVPGDLASIAHRLAAVHQHEFEEAGVKLEITGQPQAYVSMDKNQVEQVMRNLVINGLHATSQGGVVTIEIDGNGFSVADTGSGMSEETVKNLFMPFFTTKPKGTGLGLSNCRKIVEAHGGVIEVESKPGKGSRFAVRFTDHLKVAA
ncbi:MAG: GAF domain-containing protein [Armatimonadetes bacterium]|nr:GAF domain-containing protein [Armatimonadota bacterium]